MYRTGILLLGMASLVASSILIERNRLGVNPYQAIGLNAMQSLDPQSIFSRDELLRQKFILDILEQINLPLQNQELLQLGSGDVTSENLYIQPLDQDMLLVLDLMRKNQVLENNVAYTINNEQNLRQMVGLYKLLVNARDFQTFQRLVIYARRNLNTELFVNSLVLAMGERSDTNMLIIPALYEILPHLYQDSDLIEEIRKISEQNLLANSDGVSSIRPNLLDVITLERQNRLLNTRLPETRGMLNILNRAEKWMPWRELHQQLASRRALGGRTLQQDEKSLQKLVISVPARGVEDKPIGLFTEDIGLKAYLNVLIDELVVKQSLSRKIGRVQLQQQIIEENRNRNYRDKYTTENRNRDVFSQRSANGIDSSTNNDRSSFVGRSRIDPNQDSIELGQRRQGNRLERPLEAARELYANEARGRNRWVEGEADIIGETNNNKEIPYAGRRPRNRFPIRDAERRITANQAEYPTQTQYRDIVDESNDDSVSSNDNRLLFVGRRRKNLSGISSRNEMDIGNIFADETISGGRHVSRDEHRDRNSRRDERKERNEGERKYVDRDDDRVYSRSNDQDQEQQRISNTRRDEDDILGSNPGYSLYKQQQKSFNQRYGNTDNMDRGLYYRTRYGQGVSGINQDITNNDRDEDEIMASNLGYSSYKQQQKSFNQRYGNNDNMDRGLYYRTRYGQGVSGTKQDIQNNDRDNVLGSTTLMGRGRNDNLDTSNRNRQDITQLNEDEVESNQGNNDDSLQKIRTGSELPTTDINDERLLHINRRRLNEIQEGRRVGSFGDDEQKNSWLDRRSRLNDENEGDRMYVDRDGDSTRRYTTNEEEGDTMDVYRVNDNIGRWNLVNRRGNDKEEGERKYVDRDDDRVRYGNVEKRRDRNAEEGDRKYVDRDDDKVRGDNILNRLSGRNDDIISGRQSQDRLNMNRNSMNMQSDQNNRRYRRSLGNERSLNGRLLIHTLQQLAARMNIEHISLGQSQELAEYMRQGNNRVLEQVNDISQRLDVALQEEIPRISALPNEEKINELGLWVAGQIRDLGLLDILGEITRGDNNNQEYQLANVLQQHLNQLTLGRIVDIIDSQIKNLQNDRDISLQGVTINNINVGKLQTFVEYTDVDLTNLLNINIDYSDTNNKKMVVGRIPRLNHKSFSVKLDIDSDRRQQVVIRLFLGPKTDARGNIVSLIEQRQNYILLDINAIELKEGRNRITLKSNEISWTSRDTTPCSEIYERVMRALDGDLVLRKDVLIGQSNLFPHRLLIPRGRVNGLPMQLLTVITPVEQGTGRYLERNLVGLDSLLVDRRPLNYPLDGDIQNLNSFLTLPNVFVNDVNIYHDDNISHSRLL